MVFTPIRNGRRRVGVLALSYLSLIAIGALSWSAREFHVGALAAIPLLFIAYYTRLPVALITAFVSGIVLTLVDYPLIPHGGQHDTSRPAACANGRSGVVTAVTAAQQGCHGEAGRDCQNGRRRFLDSRKLMTRFAV